MVSSLNSSGRKPGRDLFKQRRPFTSVMFGALVMMSTLLPVNAVSAEAKASAASKASPTQLVNLHRHARHNTYMKRKWGVELIFVRTTAAGYMLEFRYKVLDARKSKLLFERQIKPVLTHVRTGAKLIVPTPAKTGALRNSNPPKTGKVYWMFFANPSKLVKTGDKVNIDIGEFHANGLVVKQ